MSGSKQELKVFAGQEKEVGTITLPVGSESDIQLHYSDNWIKTGFPISPHLPLNREHTHNAASNYLRNLLPEGQALDDLTSNTTISKANTFGLIAAIGRETSGALSFYTKTPSETVTSFEEISESKLTAKLQLAQKGLEAISIWNGATRLSVAGVQDKLNLLVKHDGSLGFGEGALCSNYIFKFETGRAPCIVANELFTMLLAKKAGLDIPEVGLRTYGTIRTFTIKRFDRFLEESGNSVKRRHVIDSCQATNTPPSYKYERQHGDERDAQLYRDGVSFPKLFDVKTVNRVEYQTKLIQWMTFNILNGNYDAHGKNVSFHVTAKGLRLTPFYDLVNIEAVIRSPHNTTSDNPILPDDRSSRYFAMSIGEWEAGSAGNFTNEITAYMLADFASRFEVSLSRMELVMMKTIDDTIMGMEHTKAELLSNYDLNPEEIKHIDLCISVVSEAADRLKPEVAQIPLMSELL
ncbi:HipA domain-containing protein [Vibrio breoganii]|uniref:HipA domain-containing protein n=1 Tax=Vibrio breoganii TaxID=553239 RepID=UPI000C843F26|nr:HipA domain-containing protein [Vibrio breoganii]PML12670.1 HIPA protein [Vibrio breoganii]